MGADIDYNNAQWYLGIIMNGTNCKVVYGFFTLFLAILISFYQAPTSEHGQIDGWAEERHNSIALAMELCLSCTNLSKKILRDLTMHNS